MPLERSTTNLVDQSIDRWVTHRSDWSVLYSNQIPGVIGWREKIEAASRIIQSCTGTFLLEDDVRNILKDTKSREGVDETSKRSKTNDR